VTHPPAQTENATNDHSSVGAATPAATPPAPWGNGDPFVNNRDMPDDISTTQALSFPAQPAPGTIVGFVNESDVLHVQGGTACSFTSATPVATPEGEKAIGDLQVGDKVMAYNPKTHKMEAEPVLHVWKNTDSDLIDLTITVETPAHDGKPATKKSEVIHTTSEHPFLTKEQGFTPAGQLKVGMHVQRADGGFGVVTGWKTVTATKTMYNLEVQQDHTFAVGDGEWVVHNRCDPDQLRRNLGTLPNSATLSLQAQHLVPCQISGLGSLPHAMVSLAETGNPDFLNEAWNGIELPDNWAHARWFGMPRHLGSHPRYTRQVIELLNIEWGRLQARFPGGVSVADARAGVQRVANWARAQIGRAGGNCTINQVDLNVGGY
jgi:hypothetical protein